jgi:hypothetical protein
MNPDDELDHAEAEALAATLAVAKALVSLLELITPIVERRARDDVRYSLAAVVVRSALIARAGTPVAIREALAAVDT